MIAQEKTAAYVVGVVTSSPGVLFSALGWVDSIHSLLALVTVVVGLAAGVLFLWFTKIMRDREDERQVAEDKREEAMRDEQQKTREMLQKALLQHEYLSRQLAGVESELRRAHERLDVGQTKFQKVEVDMATMRAMVSSLSRSSRRPGDTLG